YGNELLLAFFNSLMASFGLLATLVFAPQCLSCFEITLALVLLSSTMSMFLLLILIVGVTNFEFSLHPSLIVKLKQLPDPGSLITDMSPPICAHSFLQMARPRPVPPYFRVVEAST